MSNTKHTPTPWAVGYGHFSKSFGIYTAEMLNNDLSQSPICIVSPIDKMDETDKANAAHIVKCVNERDDLIAALQDMYNWTCKINAGDDGDQAQQRSLSILQKVNQ